MLFSLRRQERAKRQPGRASIRIGKTCPPSFRRGLLPDDALNARANGGLGERGGIRQCPRSLWRRASRAAVCGPPRQAGQIFPLRWRRSKAGGWGGAFSILACAQFCWRLIDGIREDFTTLSASAVLLAHSPGISIRHLIPSLAKESSTAPPSSNGMSSRIIFVP